MMTREYIISRALTLITALPVDHQFDWRSLFGEEEWADITRDNRAQTVGRQLERAFCQGDDPIIISLGIARSPRRSRFQKVRPVRKK